MFCYQDLLFRKLVRGLRGLSAGALQRPLHSPRSSAQAAEHCSCSHRQGTFSFPLECQAITPISQLSKSLSCASMTRSIFSAGCAERSVRQVRAHNGSAACGR